MRDTDSDNVTGPVTSVSIGAPVGRGLHNFKNTFYCGRVMGIANMGGEGDNQCGPFNGPQCASCKRFQVTKHPKQVEL